MQDSRRFGPYASMRRRAARTVLLARYSTRRIDGIPAAVVRFDGSVYYVPKFAADRPVARKILRRRYVEPRLHALIELVMQRRPGSVIHAGAFFGDMLPSFASKTTGTLYAFEPVLEHYLVARAVIEANELTNVRLLHAALNTHAGAESVRTHRGERHIGGSAALVKGELKSSQRAQDVVGVSIDQLRISDVSIVQLDVEGWELQVLQGGVETIKAQQPVIVVEDNRNKCARFLNDLGYAEVGVLDRDHLYLTPALEAELGDLGHIIQGDRGRLPTAQ